MNRHHAACSAALALAFAGCYQGRNDVPKQTASTTLAGSTGPGPGGASSTSASASGTGGAATGTGATGGTGGHGGQVVDPCATAVLCDDFESYPAGSPPAGKWKVNMNGGTVSVDTGRARSGKNAVKVSAAAATGYRSAMISIQDPSVLPVTGNVLYGRMMFYLESAPTGTVHWTFIDGSGPVPGQGYSSIYRYGGQVPVTNNGAFVGSELMANYETPDSYQTPPVGPGSDCWSHANKEVVPVGAWSCAEWRFDGPGNGMSFWLDGVELTDLAINGLGQGCVHQSASFPWLAPTFQQIDLGWESYQADDARVLWIDDVVLSTHRVGCPGAP